MKTKHLLLSVLFLFVLILSSCGAGNEPSSPCKCSEKQLKGEKGEDGKDGKDGKDAEGTKNEFETLILGTWEPLPKKDHREGDFERWTFTADGVFEIHMRDTYMSDRDDRGNIVEPTLKTSEYTLTRYWHITPSLILVHGEGSHTEVNKIVSISDTELKYSHWYRTGEESQKELTVTLKKIK